MSWLQVPFDSLLIHFWYICVLTKREVQMAGYWQSSFSFFFFFFAFLWTVTSQSSEKRKKRNDANIQLSWPNEQYEFDIIRIKKWLVYFEKREWNRSVEKDFCSSCHERGTEKKFRVPMRNRTSDLRIPRSDALITEPQRLHGEREVYYEVRMTRVLHIARISNVDSVLFVDRNKRDGKFWAR